jgi:hypothetical protein
MKSKNIKIGPTEAYQFLLSRGYRKEAGNVYLQMVDELVCASRLQVLRLADSIRCGS